MLTTRVSFGTFQVALDIARRQNSKIRECCTAPGELVPDGTRYFLTADAQSGFGITRDGELLALFNGVKGRGTTLVREALSEGAVRLDCFDGFLPGYYAAFGFREYHREANWTPGGPDVVYLTNQDAFGLVPA